MRNIVYNLYKNICILNKDYGIIRALPFFILLTLLALAQPILLFAQEVPCDEDLFNSSNFDDPWRYRPRGNRCEGRYIRNMSSYMQVVSLTEWFEKYRLDTIEDLIIEWVSPYNKALNVRAFGIKSDLFYRMDALVSPDDKSYRWPIDVLSALRILPSEIGVVGWMNINIAGTIRRVHLPLRIHQTGPKLLLHNYEVIFQSASELAEVYISLSKVKPDGKLSNYLIEGKPLNYGYYPQMCGIKFEISKNIKTGIYYLEITAIQKNGIASDPIELWFYHSNS